VNVPPLPDYTEKTDNMGLYLAPSTRWRGLRRNAPKANARPVNFECVAVDDARLPGEILGRTG
jgi:hypothetical protein